MIYQHFAIVTVAITALLALFADGENREAVQVAVERDQARFARAAEEPELALSPELEESFGGFGEDNFSGGGLGSVAVQRVAALRSPIPWLSWDQWRRLPKEEQERLLAEAGIEQSVAPPRDVSAREIANLIEASRARSGTASVD